MNMHTVVSQDYERILINIIRILPPNRAEQLVDFARFLEAQILTKELLQEEDLTEIEADNARWEALLATDEAQTLLEKLANDALTEHQAGKTKPMAFNDEGRKMFEEPIGKLLLESEHIRLMVFDPHEEVIVKWIP